jgi:hypothetical protein
MLYYLSVVLTKCLQFLLLCLGFYLDESIYRKSGNMQEPERLHHDEQQLVIFIAESLILQQNALSIG